MLLHIVDISEQDLARDVRVIAAELKKHGGGLDRKPRWLVFNKIDAVNDADAAHRQGRARVALEAPVVQSLRHQRAKAATR